LRTPFWFSCGAGIAFGLSPALQASKADVNSALKEEGSAFGRRISSSRFVAYSSLDRWLPASFCSSLPALLLRGSQRALKIEPGYEARHVVSLEKVRSGEPPLFPGSTVATESRHYSGNCRAAGVQSVTKLLAVLSGASAGCQLRLWVRRSLVLIQAGANRQQRL